VIEIRYRESPEEQPATYRLEIDEIDGSPVVASEIVSWSRVVKMRAGVPYKILNFNVPPGCGSLQAECYYSRKYRPLDRRPEDCIEPVIADLKRTGVLRESDRILFRHAMHIPYANVIFDLEATAATATVHGYLDDIGIGYCGRYGDWAYIWTDQSFVSGENALQKMLTRAGS
jgi:protoporphyrinogen oxidase